MFTGLVSQQGKVSEFQRTAQGARLSVTAPQTAGELARGGSVSVNGVCLTATSVAGDGFRAEVAHETLRCTTVGELAVGDPVNLELPLRPVDRLGGHIVQGHVDGVGEVVAVEDDGFSKVVRVTPPQDLVCYLAPKGSVALDGVSLTVAARDEDGFSVALIPETLERTTLVRARPGTRLNIEVDVLAKYVESLALHSRAGESAEVA